MATRTVKPLGIAVDCSGVSSIVPPTKGSRRAHRLPVSPPRRLPLPATASSTASATSPTPQRRLPRAISNETLNFPTSHKSRLASALLQKRANECGKSVSTDSTSLSGQNTPPEFWAGPGEVTVKNIVGRSSCCSVYKAEVASGNTSPFEGFAKEFGSVNFEAMARPRAPVPAEFSVQPHDPEDTTPQITGAGDNATSTKRNPAPRPKVLGLTSTKIEGFKPGVDKVMKIDTDYSSVVAGKRCSWHLGDADGDIEGDTEGDGITVDAVHTGRRVLVCRERAGTLRYFGPVSFEAGIWCGVALDHADGLNDGCVKGRRYFNCAPNHGIFAPVDKVRLLSRPTKAASVSSFGVDVMSTPTPGSSTTGSQYLDEIGAHGGPHMLPLAATATISKQNSLEFDESLCSLGILTPSQIRGDFLLDDPLQSPVDVLIELRPSYTYLADLEKLQAIERLDDKLDGKITPNFDVDESDASEQICLKQQDASERTLSPEELPMDPPSSLPPSSLTSLVLKDTGDRARGGPPGSTGAGVGAGAISPGVELSDRPVPKSFISSVTSVGSLDTDGYQGDGELSRPASRNTGVARMKTSGHDALTDSDFFTESDADGLEDSTGGGLIGVARGDRRAQVIDGTLYNVVHNVIPGGGQMTQSQHQQQHQRCPSFTASGAEEMESSGIYSDLERRTDEPSSTASLEVDIGIEETAKRDANRAGAAADSSPDATTDTLSSKSEPSTVNTSEKCANLSSRDTTLTENHNSEVSQVNGAKTEAVDDGLQPAGHVGADGSPVLTTSPVANPGSGGVNSGKPAAKKYELKKHPMPKRNVESKIKAMLGMGVSASVEDVRVGAVAAARRQIAKTPKQGRWDAVMDKIAKGQEDEKKRRQLKVLAPTESVKENLTASPLKSKSRRGRGGGSCAGTNAQPGSGNSSQRSSLSDLSINHSPNTPKGSVKSTISHRSTKKVQRDSRCQEGRISSPLSDHSIQSTASHPTPTRTPMRGSVGVPPTHKRSIHADKDAGGAMKTPLARKHKSPRDHNRFAVTKTESVTAAAAAAASLAASRDNDAKPAAKLPSTAHAAEVARKVRLQLEQKRLSAGYDAMTLVVGHLVNYYDAFETPRLKAQLKQAQEQRTEAVLALDEMSAKVAGLEHELTTLKDASSAQIKELKIRHEQAKLIELDRRDHVMQKFEEQLAKMKENFQEREVVCIQKLAEEHKIVTDLLITSHQAELSELREESQRQCDESKAELESVQRKSILIESLVSPEGEDLRLQASASKCTQLQKEVDSLRVVLDIRCQELQALRHKHAVLSLDAEELTVEKKKVDTLQARLEDLEIRLNRKRNDERLALNDAKTWKNSYEHELVSSKKLSQLNEQLNWTLQTKVRAFNQLKAMSVSHNTSCDHTVDLVSQEWTSRSLPDPTCNVSEFSAVSSDSVISNSNSPGHQVSNVLERSDSISWIYQLNDNPDDMAANLSCMVPKKPMPSALKKLRKVANPDESSEIAYNWANRSPKHSSTPIKKSTDSHKDSPSVGCINLDDTDYPMVVEETPDTSFSFETTCPLPLLPTPLTPSPTNETLSLRGATPVPNDPGGQLESMDSSFSFEITCPLLLLPTPLTPSPTNETMSLRGAAPVPKDAGGEAMVSEETSEEEDFPAC